MVCFVLKTSKHKQLIFEADVYGSTQKVELNWS